MSDPNSPNKPAARSAALARRDAITPGVAAAAAESAAGHALALVKKTCAPGAGIAVYWPIRSELSTRPLIAALAAGGYEILLPVMAGRLKPLEFRRFEGEGKLVAGPMGLREPAPDAPRAAPDLLFCPLAAFDAAGARLGYGGGNYDATLKILRAGPSPPPACGYAFSFQQADALATEPHDERLDFLVTEQGVFEFGA